ncbi:hypothetical protein BCR44DRAFT_1431963 [Catenaria anguillulae PL171]|uniref:Radical S-adenosyl methionine domain-containing protein 1, mitochondrial n=1 Tax=Catenaria anguillulae PL171 TaxID=765915 RepID=A0A1Y2HSJ1_9FUNG|nr:hypothetical protein BCR44DRAFT_1431963 [Catenaria anguillulae PL171]
MQFAPYLSSILSRRPARCATKAALGRRLPQPSSLHHPLPVIGQEQRRLLSMSTNSEAQSLLPLGVYIHYPYCRHRCSYCAFNVYKLPAEPKALVSTEPYAAEIKHAFTGPPLMSQDERGLVVPKYKVKSVYFGGGTPSLAPLSWFKDCLAAIRSHAAQVDEDVEVTVEANPSDVSKEFLHQLRDLGVNRLSLGAQSLDPATLRLFERDHSVETATRAAEWAKEVFPGRVSLDFIWGRPQQSVNQWRQELTQVLDIADDHLSLYQLTFERGTRLFRNYASKPADMPTEDTLAEMYHLTIDLARSRGFNQYEVSSFSRNGAVGKHNLAYWQGYDYLGIGPGAHGRVSYLNPTDLRVRRRVKTVCIPSPPTWQAACLRDGHGVAKHTVMTEAESVHEAIVFGLRMREMGVEWERVQEVTGCERDVREHLDMDQVDKLVAGGLLEVSDERLRCTDKGLAVVDAILVRIL